MKLSYFHINKTKLDLDYTVRGTFVIELTDKKQLEELFSTHSTAILMKIGITRLNPKDQYVKKIGRELATQRLMFTVCKFKDVEIRGTKHVYFFTTELPIGKEKQTVSFGLSTIKESDEVELVYAEF